MGNGDMSVAVTIEGGLGVLDPGDGTALKYKLYSLTSRSPALDAKSFK